MGGRPRRLRPDARRERHPHRRRRMANHTTRIRRPDGSRKSGHRPARCRPRRRPDRGHESLRHGSRAGPADHPALLENRDQHLRQRPPCRRNPALPLLRIPSRRTDRLQAPAGTCSRRLAVNRWQTRHPPKTRPWHRS